jgi:energy-coupling factor transporter transmembrane protein EcfT
VTIQYVRGDSFLHNLDARTKLLMFVAFTILALLLLDPVLIGGLFFLLYGLGRLAVDVDRLNRNLRVLIVIFGTFFLFNIIFFTPDEAHFLFYLIPFTDWVPVTVEGLIRGIAVFFRFFIVVLSVHLMLYTTPPANLVLGLTKSRRDSELHLTFISVLVLAGIFFGILMLNGPAWSGRFELTPAATVVTAVAISLVLAYATYRVLSHGLPAEIGIALSLGFATVGTLSKQTQKIMDAQKARGFEIEYSNPIRRIAAMSTSLLPIFIATIERSQDIAVAILARAFDYNVQERTYRRALAFGRNDYLVMMVLGLLIFGVMLLNFYGLGNPTERLIRSALGL